MVRGERVGLFLVYRPLMGPCDTREVAANRLLTWEVVSHGKPDMCGGDGRGGGGSVENRIYYCQGAKLPVLQKNQYLHFAIAKEDANNDLLL